MSKLIRVFLVVSVLELLATFVVACFQWPILFVGAIVLTACCYKQAYSFWQQGTASWGGYFDCFINAMIGGNGLCLGAKTLQKENLFRYLFDRNLSAKTAVHIFFRKTKRHYFPRQNRQPHTLITIPTGGGKGTCFISTFLLSNIEVAIVFDTKGGENARITGEFRRKYLGHTCIYVDPFKCFTQFPATLNVLSTIDANAPDWIDKCKEIAHELVERKQQTGDGVHFLDIAVRVLTGAIAATALYAKGERRSLQGAYDLLITPENWQKAVATLSQSPGVLGRMWQSFAHLQHRELSSALSTVYRFLTFLESEPIYQSTTESSFNINDILSKKITIYFILEPERVASLSQLLRLWVGAIIRTAYKSGGKPKHNINLIIDEAFLLGKLPSISNALRVARSMGLKIQMYYQDMGQIKEAWGQEHQSILANTVNIFAGINDIETAKFVSETIGNQSVVVQSGGTSQGSSWSRSSKDGSNGGSAQSSQNWSVITRRLITPEELLTIDRRHAIVLYPGMRPIVTQMVAYFDPLFKESIQKVGNPWVITCLLKTVLFFACTTFICAVITLSILDPRNHDTPVVPVNFSPVKESINEQKPKSPGTRKGGPTLNGGGRSPFPGR